MKNLHMSKLIELARTAAADPENLREDGSIIWDFVSADLHIDTDEKSDRIEIAISKLAKSMEPKKFQKRKLTMTITQQADTIWVAEVGTKSFASSHDLQGVLNQLNDYAADLEKEMN